MDLGNKIANLRKKNSLSQEELADKIGVTKPIPETIRLIINIVSNVPL